MVIFLLTSAAILAGGVAWQEITGIYVGVGAFVLGFLAQTLWLWHRGLPALAAVVQRDVEADQALQPALPAN
jgi:hypothetical protein